MGAVATFDYAIWVARYPEFGAVTEPTAQAYFDEATIYHANDGSGPVGDGTVQRTLLNMLTAHIAARYAIINGVIPPALVGRIASAGEGSVNVSIEFNVPPGTAQWYVTTRYGSDYWFATAPFRTMRYIPGPVRVFDPFPVVVLPD